MELFVGEFLLEIGFEMFEAISMRAVPENVVYALYLSTSLTQLSTSSTFVNLVNLCQPRQPAYQSRQPAYQPHQSACQSH